MLRSCLKAATIGGLVALGLFATGTQPAHATITMDFVSVTGAGPFTWTYNGNVSTLARVNPAGVGTPGPGGVGPAPGDFFTFYDFAGLISGSETAPAGWIVQEQNLGATPGFNLIGGFNDAHYPGIIPADDPGITNVTFRYTGAPVLGGPTPLGVFTINSTTNLGIVDSASSADHVNNPGDPTDNLSESANLTVFRASAAAVPEPGTMALFGLGAVGILFKLRRRRKNEEA